MVDKSDNSCYYILRRTIGVIDMKISSKTVIYTMRIVGSIIILAALGLIAYLTWITSNVGVDSFLISGFAVGIVSSISASVMIFYSFRITFEEDIEKDRKVVEKREKRLIHFKKCG